MIRGMIVGAPGVRIVLGCVCGWMGRLLRVKGSEVGGVMFMAGLSISFNGWRAHFVLLVAQLPRYDVRYFQSRMLVFCC